jgi:hypothetical protein
MRTSCRSRGGSKFFQLAQERRGWKHFLARVVFWRPFGTSTEVACGGEARSEFWHVWERSHSCSAGSFVTDATEPHQWFEKLFSHTKVEVES